MIRLTIADGPVSLVVEEGDWTAVVGSLTALGFSEERIEALLEGLRHPQHEVTGSGGDKSPPTRRLRTPPAPTTGPVCQECAEPIAPLTEEDAIELYGIIACVSCGKDLQ